MQPNAGLSSQRMQPNAGLSSPGYIVSSQISAPTISNPAPTIPNPVPNSNFTHMPYRLHLPQFNKVDPILWFIQIEEQFNLYGLVDENNKYSCTVAALPAEVSAEVRDILIQKPVVQPYTTIKTLLLQRLSLSLDERLQRLLREETLGDRRPSQLLIRMQCLVSECTANFDESFLKSLFLQRLPLKVREILSISSDTTPIAKLGHMADQIMRAQNSSAGESVHAIINSFDSPHSQQPSSVALVPSSDAFSYQNSHLSNPIATSFTPQQSSQPLVQISNSFPSNQPHPTQLYPSYSPGYSQHPVQPQPSQLSLASSHPLIHI